MFTFTADFNFAQVVVTIDVDSPDAWGDVDYSADSAKGETMVEYLKTYLASRRGVHHPVDPGRTTPRDMLYALVSTYQPPGAEPKIFELSRVEGDFPPMPKLGPGQYR